MAQVNFRIDDETKQKAEELAARQTQLEEAVLHQEKLLSEMCELMKKGK